MKKEEEIKTWRLSKLPTPEELTLLVDKKILTTDEAKNILLKSEQVKDINELKEEIKFLKQLVEKLSNSPTQIIKTIREVEVPIYVQRDWYRPYATWCGSITTTGYSNTAGGSGTAQLSSGTTLASFSNIN